jgi:hypothetical protein
MLPLLKDKDADVRRAAVIAVGIWPERYESNLTRISHGKIAKGCRFWHKCFCEKYLRQEGGQPFADTV